MKISAVNETRNNQSVSKSSYTSPNVFLKNNPMDTFELSTPKVGNSKISFKGKEVAKLFTQEGILKMTDHFSVLKGREPGLASIIDAVKDFVLEVNNNAKVDGTLLKFSWEPILEENGVSFRNTRYIFENGNVGLFDKKKLRVQGSGESLYDLIKYADNENIKIKKMQEEMTGPRLEGIKNEIKRLENSSSSYDKLDAQVCRKLYIDKTCNVRTDASNAIIATINDDALESCDYAHFDEVFSFDRK